MWIILNIVLSICFNIGHQLIYVVVNNDIWVLIILPWSCFNILKILNIGVKVSHPFSYNEKYVHYLAEKKQVLSEAYG